MGYKRMCIIDIYIYIYIYVHILLLPMWLAGTGGCVIIRTTRSNSSMSVFYVKSSCVTLSFVA